MLSKRQKPGISCLAVIILLAGTSAGCGRRISSHPIVSGEVQCDGVPLREGLIVFASTGDDPIEYSGNIRDGKYAFQIEEGQFRVKIMADRDIPGIVAEEIGGVNVPKREQFLPARFNTETELSADTTKEKILNFQVSAK